MILTHERAAGGEIAAGKGLGEWPPEGKPNGFDNYLVGATEQTLRKQCQHMMVCVEWAFLAPSRVAPQEDFHTLVPAKVIDWDRSFLYVPKLTSKGEQK